MAGLRVHIIDGDMFHPLKIFKKRLQMWYEKGRSILAMNTQIWAAEHP